jgi:hypothetical protein
VRKLHNKRIPGVTNLHRDPASRRRQRKGKSQTWDSKIWSWVSRDSDPRKTALARASSIYKMQTRLSPLLSSPTPFPLLPPVSSSSFCWVPNLSQGNMRWGLDFGRDEYSFLRVLTGRTQRSKKEHSTPAPFSSAVKFTMLVKSLLIQIWFYNFNILFLQDIGMYSLW